MKTRKSNESGFTLIEIIAVVVILGVILTIAVPAVSSYIVSSRKTNYAATANSYLETIRGEYEMKEFGDYIDEDELMIVPVKLIHLETGGKNSSPFGDFDYGRSYAVITTELYTDNYYINFYDSSGYGLLNVKSDSITSSRVEKLNSSDIVDIGVFFTCNNNMYEFNDNVFTYNSKDYVVCDHRVYGSGFSSDYECNNNSDLPVIVMCEK